VLEEKSEGAGTVVAHGDHRGMADALVRYATDSAAQAAAGRAGRAAAEILFDPDAVVERYERVYRELGEDR
jgi:glycosyltransferase involved in cell wall biosynthesis